MKNILKYFPTDSMKVQARFSEVRWCMFELREWEDKLWLDIHSEELNYALIFLNREDPPNWAIEYDSQGFPLKSIAGKEKANELYSSLEIELATRIKETMFVNKIPIPIA